MIRSVSVLVIALVAHTAESSAQATQWYQPAYGSVYGAEIRFEADPGDSLYRRGRQLFNTSKFSQAVQVFDELLKNHPDSEYVPQAMYWKGMSLYKMGVAHYSRALQTFEDLVEKHPNDHWKGLAQQQISQIESLLALSGDPSMRDRIDSTVRGRNCENEQSRATALAAYQQQDPDQFFEVLKRVLARRDKCSVVTRRNAVYLLSVGTSDEMDALIISVATTDPDPQVRAAAIPKLVELDTDAAAEALGAVLRGAADQSQQEEALNALASSKSFKARREIKKFIEDPEASEELRERAIQYLVSPSGHYGYGATSVAEQARQLEILKENAQLLKEIYPTLKTLTLKQTVLLSLIQLGLPEHKDVVLGAIGNAKEPLDLRVALLSQIIPQQYYYPGYSTPRSKQKSFVTAADLAALYDKATGTLMKTTLMGYYSQATDDVAFDQLCTIARTETDKDVQRQALMSLQSSKNPKAAACLVRIVNPPASEQ